MTAKNEAQTEGPTRQWLKEWKADKQDNFRAISSLKMLKSASVMVPGGGGGSGLTAGGVTQGDTGWSQHMVREPCYGPGASQVLGTGLKGDPALKKLSLQQDRLMIKGASAVGWGRRCS